MQRKQRGFSLIELLIVVAIILTIAAIAIPNLMRAKMSANEASAVSSMRLLVNCIFAFRIGHPDIGFPISMIQLGPVAVGGMDGCIDVALMVASMGAGSPPKNGYAYSYTSIFVGGINARFTLDGMPSVCERTGIRTYFTDDSGVIRFLNVPGCPWATVQSPPI